MRAHDAAGPDLPVLSIVKNLAFALVLRDSGLGLPAKIFVFAVLGFLADKEQLTGRVGEDEVAFFVAFHLGDFVRGQGFKMRLLLRRGGGDDFEAGGGEKIFGCLPGGAARGESEEGQSEGEV